MVESGQRLLCKVRKGDRRVPQAAALAVPDLQEDMVRELPEEEGWPGVQEARMPRVLHRDARRRHERKAVKRAVLFNGWFVKSLPRLIPASKRHAAFTGQERRGRIRYHNVWVDGGNSRSGVYQSDEIGCAPLCEAFTLNASGMAQMMLCATPVGSMNGLVQILTFSNTETLPLIVSVRE